MTATFPEILKNELSKRQSRNPRYSLRSFANTLGVSPSFLSKVLNGKKSVSEATFLKLANRLEIDVEHIEAMRTRLPSFRPGKLSFTPIQADHFQIIADWHYYAILEALSLHDFEPTAKWISQKLEISEQRAQAALDRLFRLGCLKKDSSGKLHRRTENYTTAHLPTPTLACREHERQILQMALSALDRINVTERDQSSLTIAIPKSRFKEAQEKIDHFRGEMASLLQRRGKRDSIYHLSISFFPVTPASAPVPTKKERP